MTVSTRGISSQVVRARTPGRGPLASEGGIIATSAAKHNRPSRRLCGQSAARALDERAYAHFLPGGSREDAEVLAALLLGEQDTVSSRRGFSGDERQQTAMKGNVA